MRFRAFGSSQEMGTAHDQQVIATGEHDMTGEAIVRRFWRRCRIALESKPKNLVIDLNDVVRADTKLIACLAGLYQLGRDEQVHIEVQASSAVRTVARICHLEALLQSMAPGPKIENSQHNAQPAVEIGALISKAL